VGGNNLSDCPPSHTTAKKAKRGCAESHQEVSLPVTIMSISLIKLGTKATRKKTPNKTTRPRLTLPIGSPFSDSMYLATARSELLNMRFKSAKVVH